MYATNNQALLHQYQNDSVMTAGPAELVVMLYDGMIKQVKLADIFIEDSNIEKANLHLGKAQAIVEELLRSLDLRYPIAAELMKLYEYMLWELAEINLHKDRARIPDLLGIMGSLRDAWAEVRSMSGKAYSIEE